jgi:primosomal protein N' (replication factor Y)
VPADAPRPELVELALGGPEEEGPPLFADVALGVPQEEPFQYAVPEGLRAAVAVGKRVRVPLRNQTRWGYVVGLSRTPLVASPRPIEEVLDPEPLIGPRFLELARWVSQYYFSSWGQAIEAGLPAPFKKGVTTMRRRAPKGAGGEGFIHATPEPRVLTPDQTAVRDRIAAALDRRAFARFLLHGVTASGKTEVYLNLIKKLLADGRGAIVLVPEISLTPQTTDRFASRFEGKVAVLHSGLAAGKRLEEWHRIRRGDARVVVGARSAVFSPVPDLGLVIIDEEHDDSYKQDETPRYDAWRVAEERCRLEGAVLVRATATPRLESYHQALQGQAELLELARRIEGRPLPSVEIIDMREEFRGRVVPAFSRALESAVRAALERGEQVMLFLNRRGFASFVSCVGCGHVMACDRCRVSLVFHHGRQALVCHTCSKSVRAPKVCPACDKGYLLYGGLGTEKVESEVHRLFPRARVARMDTDTTRRAGSHERILRAFRKREVDVLLGTQMIAKGHDFPGVSLIGVISADTALHLPDFRAAERAFDLLTQVAGRAGRENTPGRVVIQTYVPRHYAVTAAQGHDYRRFYDREIGFREELGFPPFRHLVDVTVAAPQEPAVLRKALEFKRHLEAEPGAADVLGPSPALVPKRRGVYLWHLLLRGDDPVRMSGFLRERLRTFDKRGVRFTVDVDPR